MTIIGWLALGLFAWLIKNKLDKYITSGDLMMLPLWMIGGGLSLLFYMSWCAEYYEWFYHFDKTIYRFK
jgi:hypothetical protein